MAIKIDGAGKDAVTMDQAKLCRATISDAGSEPEADAKAEQNVIRDALYRLWSDGSDLLFNQPGDAWGRALDQAEKVLGKHPPHRGTLGTEPRSEACGLPYGACPGMHRGSGTCPECGEYVASVTPSPAVSNGGDRPGQADAAVAEADAAVAEADGVTVYADLAKIEHEAEETKCARMTLDDHGVPKADGVAGYSLVGRIMRYGEMCAEAALLAAKPGSEEDGWRESVQEACDLLAERRHGNAARSPGHNARLVLEAILAPPTAAPSEGTSDAFTQTDIRHGFHLYMDGDRWCAVGPHFKDLALSSAGFGKTQIEAVEDLLRQDASYWQKSSSSPPMLRDFKVWSPVSNFSAAPVSAHNSDSDVAFVERMADAACTYKEEQMVLLAKSKADRLVRLARVGALVAPSDAPPTPAPRPRIDPARYRCKCGHLSSEHEYKDEVWCDECGYLVCDRPPMAAGDVASKSAVDREGGRPLPFDRDELGRMVREAWVRWALTQEKPKPSWLIPYEQLSEHDKEADRQIGEAIARWTLIGDAARAARHATSTRHEGEVSEAEVEAAHDELDLLACVDINGKDCQPRIEKEYVRIALEAARAARAARTDKVAS